MADSNRGDMDFTSSCGSQMSTASMASCQYPIIEGPSATQPHSNSMNMQDQNISPQSSMNMGAPHNNGNNGGGPHNNNNGAQHNGGGQMGSQMSDDEVSTTAMYGGDNNGYSNMNNNALTNIFAGPGVSQQNAGANMANMQGQKLFFFSRNF